jgi:hypothetical protein
VVLRDFVVFPVLVDLKVAADQPALKECKECKEYKEYKEYKECKELRVVL